MRQRFKKIGKRKEQTIEFDGEKIILREMSGNMRDYFEQDQKKRIKFKGLNPDLNTQDIVGTRAIIVAMHVVAENGVDMEFDYLNKEDLAEISGFSSEFIEVIVDTGLDLSGISKMVQEEAEKKSLPDQQKELG